MSCGSRASGRARESWSNEERSGATGWGSAERSDSTAGELSAAARGGLD